MSRVFKILTKSWTWYDIQYPICLADSPGPFFGDWHLHSRRRAWSSKWNLSTPLLACTSPNSHHFVDGKSLLLVCLPLLRFAIGQTHAHQFYPTELLQIPEEWCREQHASPTIVFFLPSWRPGPQCKHPWYSWLGYIMFWYVWMQPTLKTPPLQSAWPAMPNGGAGVETEERVPRRLRGAGDRKDIFALVKGNMVDSSLIQPPLLVWPESFLGTTENFWNCVNSTTETIQHGPI